MTGDDDLASHAPVGVRSLLEGAERYRSLFTHNPHAVFSLDLEGYYTDVNPATETLTGYTRDEMREMTFLDIIHPDEGQRVYSEFIGVLSGEPRRLETSIRHQDGRAIDIDLVGLPVVVKGEVIGVHGVAEDITARHRATRELDAALAAAEAANVAKSLFVAHMSHELRTPLTTMVATAEMLEDTGLDMVQTRLVAALARGGQRLTRLIADVLDISRIEAGVLSLVQEPFDPRGLVDDVVAWAREQASHKGLDVEVSVGEGLGDWLVGDTLRLAQVMVNLLDNAVKFTEQGSVAISARTVAADRFEPGEVGLWLRVRDTGVGITPEQRAGIFEPFSQADASVTRRHEGAGLGLAIVRELVALMGGEVDLHSVVGEGTTVTVVVPLRVA
jgi:PAS domain S-box-containing protein